MHPSVQQILRNPKLRAQVERALATRGRGGDTLIAHLNPREAAMLKASGGSGTINPCTGLREFADDSARRAARGRGRRRRRGGGTGGSGGLANWQQAILAAYPQYAGILQQLWGRQGLVA
jgi:hypothetical protein